MRRSRFADWVILAFGRQHRGHTRPVAFCLTCALFVTSYSVHAQPAGTGGATAIVTGLGGPGYVAVHYSGDVIIADVLCDTTPPVVGEDCNIVIATPSSGGTYTKNLIIPNVPYVQGLLVDNSKDVYYMVPFVLYEEAPQGPQQGPPWSQNDFHCSSLKSPTGLAFGSPGGFYVADSGAKNIYSLGSPPSCASMQVVVSNASSLGPIAVDSSGNIYMASGETVFKETRSGATYTQSIVYGGYSSVKGIAVDSSSNVYVSDGGGSVYVDSPCGASYLQAVVFTPKTPPGGIALDNANNLYVAEPQGGQVWKIPSRTGSAGSPAPPTCVIATPVSNSPINQS